MGAGGATEAKRGQRTADAPLGSLPSSSTALIVERTIDGTTWTATPAGQNPCPPKALQTTSSQVRVRVDLLNAGLPALLNNIFVVDIPLMPPISLKGAQISGVFRCEGN